MEREVDTGKATEDAWERVERESARLRQSGKAVSSCENVTFPSRVLPQHHSKDPAEI